MAIKIYQLSGREWRISHTHEKNNSEEYITIDSEEIIELAKMLKKRGF